MAEETTNPEGEQTDEVAAEAVEAETADQPAETEAVVEVSGETEEATAETPAPAEKPEPTGKFAEIIKDIEGLSVLELADLVKALEERFGVSAAAPVAAAGAPAGGGEAETEEKSSYTVVLQAAGGNKIAAIKAVREITGLGLKEAKDLVEGAPKELKQAVPKDEAEGMKAKLEEAGATAELK